jgi:hypothetical protein
MTKRTITKWWIWGAAAIGVSAILIPVFVVAVAAAMAGGATPATRPNFASDSTFWVMFSLFMLFCVIATGGVIGQIVAWIGAVFNTHRRADKRWFKVLLWGGLVGFVVLPLLTLFVMYVGIFAQWGLPYTVVDWPGYVVAGVIELGVMLSYLVAGPDGMAIRQRQITTLAVTPTAIAATS